MCQNVTSTLNTPGDWRIKSLSETLCKLWKLRILCFTYRKIMVWLWYYFPKINIYPLHVKGFSNFKVKYLFSTRTYLLSPRSPVLFPQVHDKWKINSNRFAVIFTLNILQKWILKVLKQGHWILTEGQPHSTWRLFAFNWQESWERQEMG